MSLLMACDAPAHSQWDNLLGDFHLRHVPVTLLARHPGPHVSLVREPYVVGEIVHAYPWDRLFVFPVPEDLLNLRTIGQHHPVAPRTTLDGRDTRHRRSPGIDMTELTVQLDVVYVNPMAKRDWLFGRVARGRWGRTLLHSHEDDSGGRRDQEQRKRQTQDETDST